MKNLIFLTYYFLLLNYSTYDEERIIREKYRQPAAIIDIRKDEGYRSIQNRAVKKMKKLTFKFNLDHDLDEVIGYSRKLKTKIDKNSKNPIKEKQILNAGRILQIWKSSKNRKRQKKAYKNIKNRKKQKKSKTRSIWKIRNLKTTLKKNKNKKKKKKAEKQVFSFQKKNI